MTLSLADVAQLMVNSAAQHHVNLMLIQKATGASIVKAESGGDPTARNPTSGTYSNGTYDRGIWQLNTVHTCPDSVAFDPQLSTDYVYVLTNGFTIPSFNKIWVNGKGVKSKGLNVNNILDATAQLSGTTTPDVGGIDLNPTNAGGIITDPGKALGQVVDGAKNVTQDAIAAVAPWATSLASLLSNLGSGDWWKRVGIGALGVIVLLIALVLLFGKDVAPVAKAAML